MTQLNINVTRTDRERFDSYAAEFGLDRTGLANLLLCRALANGQLSKMQGADPVRDQRRDAKITAHLTEKRWADFVARAKELNMSNSSAGALVVLTELTERWLESAVCK